MPPNETTWSLAASDMEMVQRGSTDRTEKDARRGCLDSNKIPFKQSLSLKSMNLTKTAHSNS